jgi:uncharacterized protein YkwD
MLALLAGAVLAAGSCAHADSAADHASAQAIRDAVVCLINGQRAAHHLPKLHARSRLDRAAQAWADKMVTDGSLRHGDPPARIRATGYTWSAAGENIATGYPTPRAVVAAWIGDRAHCRIIMDPAFSDVGTGVNRRSIQVSPGPATWAVDFARPLGQRVPSNNFKPVNGCPY